MTGFDYEHWLTAARRVSRRASDAPDLLHDAILAAIRADRTDFTADDTRRWFSGVLKNTAAMTARTTVRRTRREEASQRRSSDRTDPIPSPPADFIESLPRSARAVAALALAGMRREEITAALRIVDTAFRQRLTTIRRAWDKLPVEQRASAFEGDADPPLHPRPDPHFELGLIRRALLSCVKRTEGLGSHDPDGHLIVISTSQASADRQRPGKETRT